MKTIDMRFDSDLIQSWIGKRFNKYKKKNLDKNKKQTNFTGIDSFVNVSNNPPPELMNSSSSLIINQPPTTCAR